MSARVLFLGVFLLGACTTRLEVLSPQEQDGARPLSHNDAGLDAERPRGDEDAGRDGGPSDRIDAAGPDAGNQDADSAVLSGVARMVSAFGQTCVLNDGALECWGLDTSGQVGIGSDAAVLAPTRIDPGPFSDVCAGEFHSCALGENGVAECWGDNTNGQLGTGDFLPHPRPTPVIGSLHFTSIACGGRNTCALTAQGGLYCWGENLEGRLGQGDPPPSQPGTLPDSALPVAVRADLHFTEVSLGQGHVCAVTDANALYCWGRNSDGELGISDPTAEQRAPVQVTQIARVDLVACGQSHTCAIDQDGKLYCWGRNGGGLLGLTSDAMVVRVPTQVGSDNDYASVAASWFHSCALKKSGTLQCWGRNEEGQLGLGDMTQRNLPTRVGPEFVWRAVAVGQFHTCAFGRSMLYCWGANDAGQLGLGDTARRYVPIGVSLP